MFSWIKHHRILDHVKRKKQLDLCRHLTLLDIPPRTKVLHEGEPGDAFYMVLSGSLKATADGFEDVVLTAGMTFGEKALDPMVTKSPAVVSTSHCQLIVLKSSHYRGAGVLAQVSLTYYKITNSTHSKPTYKNTEP